MRNVLPTVLLTLCAGSAIAKESASISIVFDQVDGQYLVAVSSQGDAKFDKTIQSVPNGVLVIHVVGDGGTATEEAPTQGVFGRVRVRGQRLEFVPKYPLNPRVTYRVVLDLKPLGPPFSSDGALSKPITKTLRLPAPPKTPPTTLVRVYPTQDTLPENQLKFYLHFSAPMSESDVYKHIRLLRHDGTLVDYPFLRLEPALWDPDGKRMTLLIDPGRIKQGLKPREDVGPALVAGETYKLMIARTWRDENNKPLAKDFVKTFRVTTPDATQPAPSHWRLDAPLAGTTKPLVLTFDEPLDHAMLQHVLAISDADGKAVEGEVGVADSATKWTWTPKRPWSPGKHRLNVSSLLEDLAGNSLARPFEVDQFEQSRPQQSTQIRLPFRISERP